jgi:hypothetical protein
VLAGRRAAIARHPTQQAIDRVQLAAGGAGRLTLTVFFLPGDGPAAAGKPRRPAVTAAHVRIWADDQSRGLPQRDLVLLDLADPADAPDTVVLTLATGRGRAAAAYLLEFVGVETLDPFFAQAVFTTGPVLPPEPAVLTPAAAAPTAAVDYLSRDYASTRMLMLDRLSTLMPKWADTEAADVVQTVVEVLAYAADHLSYFQDAVATEAYLGTARHRISVRRHARLLDYVLHEGCNARAWVRATVTGTDPVRLPAGTRVLTRVAGQNVPLLAEAALVRAVADGAIVFETTADAVLHPGLHELPLYDWGLAGYTLAQYAIGAAVRGGHPGLAAGQVLLLQAAGEPTAHPVRLTGVRTGVDPLGDDGRGVAITLLDWHPGDALAAPLLVTDGAVALGNIVLADHGHTGSPEALQPLAGAGQGGDRAARAHRARLGRSGLTWREDPPDDSTRLPATSMLGQDPARAGAALTVTDTARTWVPRPDLLASDRLAAHVVVEMEDDGTAQVRFGDGEHGRAAEPHLPLLATYRVGNGAAGNVGRGALAHLAPPTGRAGQADPRELSRVIAITNPVPGAGGTDPEPVERARLAAPQAFRQQRRCVVEEDFVAVAEAHPDVLRAAASFRWTGSWHTAVIVVDRRGDLPVDAAFRAELLSRFEPYRLAGADIDVRGPRRVSADIVVEAGVAPGFRAEVVARALAGAFGQPDFTRRPIGVPLYLSQVIARAAAVAGVAWADVVRFQRRGGRPRGEIGTGVLAIGPQEALRLAPGDIAVAMIGETP